jgi:hypothetical protein
MTIAVLAACCGAVQAFVPRLLQQEKFIFDELVSYVWTHTFVPAVAASRARPANAALAAGVVKRSGQEAALRKWLGALEAVSSQLKGLGREGHTSTLRHQVRRCCCAVHIECSEYRWSWVQAAGGAVGWAGGKKLTAEGLA